MTGVLQSTIWFSLIVAVVYCFASTVISGPVLMLLISPMFMLLALYYPGNAMMKEIIAYLGLALMAATAASGRRGVLWAGCVVFGLAGFANGANTFLTPAALIFILIYFSRGIISKRQAIAAAALVTIASVTAVAIATIYKGNGLYGPICEELGHYPDLARYCVVGGAIWWLDQDSAYAFAYMWKINIASNAWPKFILGYALAIMPFFFFRLAVDKSGTQSRIAYAVVVFGIVFMAPLFVVATDWGRWINMYVFALTLLTVAAVRLDIVRSRTRSVSPLFLLYGIVWTMPEWGGSSFTFGLVGRIANAGRQLLGH